MSENLSVKTDKAGAFLKLVKRFPRIGLEKVLTANSISRIEKMELVDEGGFLQPKNLTIR